MNSTINTVTNNEQLATLAAQAADSLAARHDKAVQAFAASMRQRMDSRK